MIQIFIISLVLDSLKVRERNIYRVACRRKDLVTRGHSNQNILTTDLRNFFKLQNLRN